MTRCTGCLLLLYLQPSLLFSPQPHAALPLARARIASTSAYRSTVSAAAAAVALPNDGEQFMQAHKAPVQGKAPDAAPRNKLLRSLWAIKRSVWIWSCVGVQACKIFINERRALTGNAKVEANRKLAAGLRDMLIQLGPTFIKIGQLLSTRVDVLPPETIQELARLQNEVPSFDPNRALAIVQTELNRTVDELFESFERTPLAAASLAQVHRAVLKTGEQVVVKVQR
jgi:hypothetical protein